jgi:ABC-type transporter Mla subunit MlaD
MALQDLTPQLRTRLRKVEWLVFLFLVVTGLVMLAAVGWWIKQTGEARGWFVIEVPYFTYLEDAGAVKVGTPVKMMGFTIGTVDLITTEADTAWTRENKYNVFVHFLVREPYYGYIHTDSYIRLGGTGIDLLGGSWLEVERAEGQGIPTVKVTNNLPNVLDFNFAFKPPAADRTNKFGRYRPSERSDKGYYLRTERTISLVDNAEAITGIIRDALPGLTNDLAHILGNLNGIAAELRPALNEPGGVGRLLIPTNLNEKVELTLTDLHALSGRLDPLLAKVSETLQFAGDNAHKIGPLMDDVRGAVTNIEATVIALRTQISDTNLVSNVSRLADRASQLTATTDQLLRNHWLFRSAFRTNSAKADESTPRVPPPSRRRF